MAQILDLFLDQGSDFTATLPPVLNPDNSVLDLTTYTVKSQIRRSYASEIAVQLTCTVSTPSNGIIVLSLPHSETGGLVPTRYVYDVVVITSGGLVTTVFEGLAVVNPGVTSKPNTVLISPYLPDDFGGW